MEILLSNPYNMVFAGTVMVGVIMLALSLVAFLVLVLVVSFIHGLVTLSRKVVTSVFSRAGLIAKQPATVSNSANATAGSPMPAVVNAGKSKSSAYTAIAPRTIAGNATAGQASSRPAIPVVV